MDNFSTFCVILIVLAVIFLICRELVCWYYKINAILDVLEKIAKNTYRLIPENERIAIESKANDETASSNANSSAIVCPHCSKETSKWYYVCQNCGKPIQ